MWRSQLCTDNGKRRKWKRNRSKRGRKIRKIENKWRGVTILLWTVGHGHPTPIRTPCPPHTYTKISKTLIFAHFDLCPQTNGPTNQWTDIRTKPLIGKKVVVCLRLFDIFQRNIVFIILCVSWENVASGKIERVSQFDNSLSFGTRQNVQGHIFFNL